ncbi:N-acetylglucosamine-6-phosphate deacetylase [Salinarimonas soli]|uniref:N-acetylglucosamine-6-phosphate deacetylase n=1 Tax=Salinarimonas soli TaxID=1638099 RepID=A0A5B2W0L5_9HYPH|nr:N-acetylglucosamine-6-phosphate deacetylase [Salinarimonas soli]KAA2244260.1 N-acetylglucosamine-6-phosphate deacetylase [Salinarimonas soli]
MAQRVAASSPREVILADRVFDGERFVEGQALIIEDGRIAGLAGVGEIAAGTAPVRRLDGCTLAPGFIDWQVNGGGGVLLNDAPDAAGMAAIADAHRRFGTTGLLPTLITDAPTIMERLAGALGERPPGVLGVHLEGPFINPERKGVHPPAAIRAMGPADLELLASFGRFGRSVVTLAPERAPEGAIEALARAGIRVSVGHSAATAAEVRRAADRGLSGVTHLFNAMSQITPREPGVVGAAFDDARLHVGIIADGHHVDPVNLRIAFRQIGPERLGLVSDAMSSVGAASPDFTLMGRQVRLVGDRLTVEDGTLAGAHVTMIASVQRAVAMAGIPLEAALAMASRSPASFLGLDDERGRIRPAFVADLVAFDSSFQVRATWVAGRYRAETMED